MTPTRHFHTREHRLIEAIKEWSGEHGIGDDCALLPGGILATTDTLVEGVHFRLSLSAPEDVGWKSIAVNLSDIAAMAGRPRFLLVSLSLPDSFSDLSIKRLYAGIIECARAYDVRVVGGDLTGAPVVVVAVTALADVHEKGVLSRSGARPGDVVAVTGDFGAGAAGLLALEQELPGFTYAKQRHRRPEPRLAEAWSLAAAAGGQGALMDASDGLADALVQLSRASCVGMAVDAAAVPVHEETAELASRSGVDPLEWAFYGGEDFELVACLPEQAWSLLAGGGSPWTRIGAVTDSGTIELTHSGPLGDTVDLARSYQHWTE